jgi:hypothetical protein
MRFHSFLIELNERHAFQNINQRIINIKSVVANVYAPIKGSIKKINGTPDNENPIRYPYPQYRFFNAIIIPGIIVVKITERYASTSIEAGEFRIINIFAHAMINPIIKQIIVPISIFNFCSLFTLVFWGEFIFIFSNNILY